MSELIFRLKKIVALTAIVSLWSLVLTPFVLAADTGDVTATVTVKNIAITVSDGSIAYGSVAAGGTKSTLSGEANDMQTVTNSGNVEEDFNIKGFNVSSGCSWTLAATQGSEQYFHKFCNDTDQDCSTPPTSYTALTTNYQSLDTNIVTSDSVDFQLQIGVPSSTACTSEATVTVTVQAVDST